MLLARADTLLWLDRTRAQVFGPLVRRTVVRRVRRAELWNGNREPPVRALLTDRDHILRRAWRTFGTDRARVRAILAEGRDRPVVVRLPTRRAAARRLDGPLADALGRVP